MLSVWEWHWRDGGLKHGLLRKCWGEGLSKVTIDVKWLSIGNHEMAVINWIIEDGTVIIERILEKEK